MLWWLVKNSPNGHSNRLDFNELGVVVFLDQVSPHEPHKHRAYLQPRMLITSMEVKPDKCVHVTAVVVTMLSLKVNAMDGYEDIIRGIVSRPAAVVDLFASIGRSRL